MDVKYFKYIIEITECGSINKAAKNLHLSQSNLSVSIKNMEKELGFSVFKRNTAGIVLTKEGMLFLKSAKKIVSEMELIENIPSLMLNKKNLSISSAYSFDLMDCFLKFKKEYPSRTYEDSFKETGLIQTVRDVIEQKYRMTLFYCFDCVSDKYHELAEKHNLKMIRLAYNEPLILLASKKNPLSQRKEIEFGDIKNYKFVMYENFRFDEWLEILGFENDNKILYVFDRGGLLDTISTSMYVTVLMKRFSDEPYSNGCVEIPVINAPCGMSAYAMYDADYTINAREKLFIKHLKLLFKSA